MKDCPMRQIPLRPHPSAMSFDHRTADRKSHAHAAGFSGEEGVNSRSPSRRRFRHRSPSRSPEPGGFVQMRSDGKFARPICDRLRRFNAVDHQIGNHLLKLDPIGVDHGQIGREFQPQLTPGG